MRGERISDANVIMVIAGSSPRARGTLEHWRGSSVGDAEYQSPPPVHPRVRGERGDAGQPWHLATRFIPACAGNAWWAPAREFQTAVHPRVRGERVSRLRLNCCACGSSPRARGTLPRSGVLFYGGRFIPACAGNARAGREVGSQAPVHPRVRGERRRRSRTSNSNRGSSPRARGTRDSV